MTRYAIVQDGEVINVALADTEFADDQGWIEADDHVAIGWSYTNGEFAAPPTPPLDVKPVTPRQARLALLQSGLLASAEAAINALPEQQKAAAEIEWMFATEFRRDNTLVNGVGIALGLSEAEIDQLFIIAAGM